MTNSLWILLIGVLVFTVGSIFYLAVSRKSKKVEPKEEKDIEIPEKPEAKPMPSGEKAPPSKESLEKQIKALKYLAEKKNNESAKKQLKVFNFLIKKYYSQ